MKIPKGMKVWVRQRRYVDELPDKLVTKEIRNQIESYKSKPLPKPVKGEKEGVESASE